MGAGFHGGFGATKGYFEGNPAAGEIVFASADYDYINNIANRKDVDPDGLYDVVGHGTPYKIKFGDGDNDYYTPRELARILKHRKDYKKNGIRLLSCNTGSLPDGFAQHLANKLNVTVWAPNYLVWAYPSGRYLVAPRSQYNQKYPDSKIRGGFIPFYPGGKKMKCKKCNSELIEYKVGDKTEYICPVCDEAPATQIDNLIEFDSNKYTIKILTSKEHDKDVLKEIAQICGCNMLEAKKIIEVTGFEFKPMDALETRALKKKIEGTGISYSISPEFRWQ